MVARLNLVDMAFGRMRRLNEGSKHECFLTYSLMNFVTCVCERVSPALRPMKWHSSSVSGR